MKNILYASSILVTVAVVILFVYQSDVESEYRAEITIKPHYLATAQNLLNAYEIDSAVDSNGLIVKGDRLEHIKTNLILDNAGLIKGVISNVEVINVKGVQDDDLEKEALKEVVSTLENKKITVRRLSCGVGPKSRPICMLYLWKKPENYDFDRLKSFVAKKLNLNPKTSYIGIKITDPHEFAQEQPIIRQK